MKKKGETVLDVSASGLPNGNDRPASPRFRCQENAEIVVFPSGFLCRGEMTNLGLKGCFIATKAPLKLQPANLVALRFTFGTHTIRLDATVANFSPGEGVDLEFEPDMAKNDRVKLNVLCEGLANGRIHSGPKM